MTRPNDSKRPLNRKAPSEGVRGPLAFLLAFMAIMLVASAIKPLFKPPSAPLSFGLTLKLVLLFPLLEEYLFRGVVQSALAERAWGARSFRGGFSGANLLTSLFFSAAHLPFHPPIWAASVFFPSLLFGWFKDRFTSLAFPVLLHMACNAAYYL